MAVGDVVVVGGLLGLLFLGAAENPLAAIGVARLVALVAELEQFCVTAVKAFDTTREIILSRSAILVEGLGGMEQSEQLTTTQVLWLQL